MYMIASVLEGPGEVQPAVRSARALRRKMVGDEEDAWGWGRGRVTHLTIASREEQVAWKPTVAWDEHSTQRFVDMASGPLERSEIVMSSAR
jgi:hypothetical protein